MDLTRIYRGMENGAEAIEENFTRITSSFENGLFVRKNIEITDLNNAKEPGIYSIPATGVENKPLPNSGSLIVNKDPGGVRQLFQTERTLFIRQFGGNPSNWTSWKEVSFKAQKTPLWTGVLGLYANQSATPSKKITDCQTGWILVFQAYESGSASESTFHYFHIPKSHAIYHNGAGINLQISDWRGVNRGLKYVYVRENQITGHEMNSISPNNKLVLTEIFEY